MRARGSGDCALALMVPGLDGRWLSRGPISGSEPEQAFLHHGGAESAGLVEHLSAAQRPGPAGPAAVLVVEEPVVDPERLVEPDAVVDRGELEPAALQRHAVWPESCREQQGVGQV